MEVQVHSIQGRTGRILPKDVQAQQVTEAHVRQAATTLEEADAWVQFDQNLKYVLINLATGAAATLCRQHQHEIGFGIPQQLNMRFALPVGTRSIVYLTKFLKPTFENNKFEESFSNWWFELNRHERDNITQVPDQVGKSNVPVVRHDAFQLQPHGHGVFALKICGVFCF